MTVIIEISLYGVGCMGHNSPVTFFRKDQFHNSSLLYRGYTVLHVKCGMDPANLTRPRIDYTGSISAALGNVTKK